MTKSVWFAVAALAAIGCSGAPATRDAAQEGASSESIGREEQAFGEPTDTVPRRPSAKTIQYEQEAIIHAPIDVVWNLLVDLPHYKDWNPWVTRADGQAVPGAHVSVDVVMGPITQKAEHVVLTVKPMKEFCWRDSGWNSWFVYGQRCRWIEELPDGTVHFKQQLLLDGSLDVVAKVFDGPCLEQGTAAETKALKETAEARAAAGSP